jgi:hypothetical protein
MDGLYDLQKCKIQKGEEFYVDNMRIKHSKAL